jgi:hypothetical protein
VTIVIDSTDPCTRIFFVIAVLTLVIIVLQLLGRWKKIAAAERELGGRKS